MFVIKLLKNYYNNILKIDKDAWYSGILYGIIGSLMCLPITISFCSIIFKDSAFSSSISLLVKLVLFSSFVHQCCFSIFSNLPFAVGQVQDAGLIFLSAMASNIAANINNPENLLPTTLFILALSSAILGIFLLITSKLKLATVVQYLPMTVIGGYLAFIGFFCGLAGLSMMAGVQASSIIELIENSDKKNFILMSPGLILGCLMYYIIHITHSAFVIPISLLSIVLGFYIILWLNGSTIEEAREYGWIYPLAPVNSPFDSWALYDISKVEWNHFPRQIIRLVAMFFVVAFSSSLDVAAIEMELGMPLDYNHELSTVGLSNLISGLTGGYTGSYIFSQTIFTMRRGINTRICGVVIAFCEILVVMIPISLTSYIPKMFFGSLLVLISVDLMYEWLICAREKLMNFEYIVCLITFFSILSYGIELGMLIGIICATFSFVFSYSARQSISNVTLQVSTAIRNFEDRSILIKNRGKIITISFRGYIFFGSAVKILEEIKKKLVFSPNIEDSLIDSNDSFDYDVMKNTYQNSQQTQEILLTKPGSSLPLNLTPKSMSKYTELNSEDLFSGPNSVLGLTKRSSSFVCKTPTKEGSFVLHSSFGQILPSSSINEIENDEELQLLNGRNNQYGSLSSSLTAGPTLRMVYKSAEKNLLNMKKNSPDGREESLIDDTPSVTNLNMKQFQEPDSLISMVLDNQSNRREKIKFSHSQSSPSINDPTNVGQEESSFNKKKNHESLKALNQDSPTLSTFKKKRKEVLTSTIIDPTNNNSDEQNDGDIYTQFLILDFSNVLGVDATAARACFLTLVHLMNTAQVSIVFTGMNESISSLLSAHNVLSPESYVFPDLDDALEWAEDQIIHDIKGYFPSTSYGSTADPYSSPSRESYNSYVLASSRRHSTIGTSRSRASSSNSIELESLITSNNSIKSFPDYKNYISLQNILEDYLEIERMKKNEMIVNLLNTENLSKYFYREEFPSFTTIFDKDEVCNKIYFIESGTVELLSIDESCLSSSSSSSTSHLPTKGSVCRVNKVSCGGIFGEADFFLNKKHSTRAITITSTTCWILDRKRFALMETNHPKLCMLIQYTFLKSLSLSNTCSMYALYPATLSSLVDLE